MNNQPLIIGSRMYHAIFGWCKVTHPANQAKMTLVELEADEIEYNVNGVRKKFYRDKKDNRHTLYTPVADLFPDEATVTEEYGLKKLALNPKITFWKTK